MKKQLIFSAAFLATALVASAQTVENVAVGASYANQTFYRLSDGTTQSTAHTTWHIAFSVLGTQDAGIFINEGAASSGSPVQLYSTGISDFSTTIDTNTTPLTNELGNAEINWKNGAFNEIRVQSNPFDYGWGAYSTSTHKVEGDKVFILRLPNGDLKKIKIDSLSAGAYHFRYADLNGNNLESKSIAKSGFSGQTLAYFSLTSGNTVAAIEPNGGWDLLFTRYKELIPDGQGGWVPYSVTGVLANNGVETAQADSVNTATVNYQNYVANLDADTLYRIGSDWKHYDFSAGWQIIANRAYFVKTADNTLWKLIFIDFQGSGTGISTLEKTDLGVINALEQNEAGLNYFEVYPNPTAGAADIVFDLATESGDAKLSLYNLHGQVLFETSVAMRTGMQAYSIPNLGLAQGSYFLRLETAKGAYSKILQIR